MTPEIEAPQKPMAMQASGDANRCNKILAIPVKMGTGVLSICLQ